MQFDKGVNMGLVALIFLLSLTLYQTLFGVIHQTTAMLHIIMKGIVLIKVCGNCCEWCWLFGEQF